LSTGVWQISSACDKVDFMNGDLIVTLIIVFCVVLISMSLHEAMHAYVAHWLGDDTAQRMGRLTLNPLAHIDPMTTIAMPLLMALAGLPPLGAARPVPFNPHRLRYDEYGMAMVGVAGPLTNLLIAIVGGLWLRLVIGFGAGIATDIFELLVIVNIGFFVFNIIPWPPLDGSRLLFSVAPQPLRDIMRTIERQGLFGFLIFFLLLFGFISPVIFDVMDWIIRLIVGTSLF